MKKLLTCSARFAAAMALVVAAALPLAGASTGYAQSLPPGAPMPPPPPPPMLSTISVTGEAKEDVVPDQAVLSLVLVSKNKELASAKKQNDELVDRLMGIATKLAIPNDKIATSSINIVPEYNYGVPQANGEPGKQILNDYMISRSLRITIDKLDNQEKLITAAVDAHIDQVNGVEWLVSDREKHAAVLRLKAFENARAKAEALAQAAGGKLGKPVSIVTEDGGTPFMSPRPGMPMAGALRANAEGSSVPALPGLIELKESVSVIFTLE